MHSSGSGLARSPAPFKGRQFTAVVILGVCLRPRGGPHTTFRWTQAYAGEVKKWLRQPQRICKAPGGWMRPCEGREPADASVSSGGRERYWRCRCSSFRPATMPPVERPALFVRVWRSSTALPRRKLNYLSSHRSSPSRSPVFWRSRRFHMRTPERCRISH
jgi:hypothetical protein